MKKYLLVYLILLSPVSAYASFETGNNRGILIFLYPSYPSNTGTVSMKGPKYKEMTYTCISNLKAKEGYITVSINDGQVKNFIPYKTLSYHAIGVETSSSVYQYTSTFSWQGGPIKPDSVQIICLYKSI